MSKEKKWLLFWVTVRRWCYGADNDLRLSLNCYRFFNHLTGDRFFNGCDDRFIALTGLGITHIHIVNALAYLTARFFVD